MTAWGCFRGAATVALGVLLVWNAVGLVATLMREERVAEECKNSKPAVPPLPLTVRTARRTRSATLPSRRGWDGVNSSHQPARHQVEAAHGDHAHAVARVAAAAARFGPHDLQRGASPPPPHRDAALMLEEALSTNLPRPPPLLRPEFACGNAFLFRHHGLVLALDFDATFGAAAPVSTARNSTGTPRIRFDVGGAARTVGQSLSVRIVGLAPSGRAASCVAASLELVVWVQLQGPELAAQFARASTHDCSWSATLRLREPGDFSLHAHVVTAHANRPHDVATCQIQHGVRCTGASHTVFSVVNRFYGAVPPTCCELCTRHPHCSHWTSSPDPSAKCILFNGGMAGDWRINASAEHACGVRRVPFAEAPQLLMQHPPHTDGTGWYFTVRLACVCAGRMRLLTTRDRRWPVPTAGHALHNVERCVGHTRALPRGRHRGACVRPPAVSPVEPHERLACSAGRQLAHRSGERPRAQAACRSDRAWPRV
jgi:hypothetical protein